MVDWIKIEITNYENIIIFNGNMTIYTLCFRLQKGRKKYVHNWRGENIFQAKLRENCKKAQENHIQKFRSSALFEIKWSWLV